MPSTILNSSPYSQLKFLNLKCPKHGAKNELLKTILILRTSVF